MTVTVKFSRRAAVAGLLAAATLATAGASGAVSGALADGAHDSDVSGDPGRVGGVDPTDEDALAEATGKDASVLDSTRSVVVPAPSFGSFMTSGGDRVPVPAESPSEGAADGVVAVELDSSGVDSSQLGAAEDHAPGSSVDDGSHDDVTAPDTVPAEGAPAEGAPAEIPAPPSDAAPSDVPAAPSESAHAEVPAVPSDTTPSEGANDKAPAPPSGAADTAPSEGTPSAPSTEVPAAPSEGAPAEVPAATSDTAPPEIPAPPSADTHAAPSEGSQADVPSAHAGSGHAATGDVAPPAQAGVSPTGNVEAPVAPSGGISGSQATETGAGGSEARTGASGASTGDTAPGDQGAPGKVTELNGGNSGVTSGASGGGATGNTDAGTPSLSASDAAARLANAQRDYDAAKAAYDAAVAGRADTASARAALADAERAVSDAEARVSAAERAVADAEADASRAGTVDWRLADEGSQARVVEHLLVQKVNAYRADAGLPALVASRTLDGEAQSWSTHMAGERDFNHDPSMSARLRAGVDGAQLSGVGENIAYAIRGDAATGKTPEQIADSLFAQWKDSPAHNRNMLGAYTVTGVGVSYEGGRVYATQKFAAVNSSHKNMSETDVSRFYTVGDADSALHVDAAAFGRTPASGGSGDAAGAAAFGWANRVGATVADGTASGLSVPGASGGADGRVEAARGELASARSGLESARGVASDARERVAAAEGADVDGALRALSDTEASLGVARADAQAAGVAGVTSVSAGVPSPA